MAEHLFKILGNEKIRVATGGWGSLVVNLDKSRVVFEAVNNSHNFPTFITRIIQAAHEAGVEFELPEQIAREHIVLDKSAPEPKPEPPFEVGDRVRSADKSNEIPVGRIGEVTAIDRSAVWVRWEKGPTLWYGIDTKCLELAPETDEEKLVRLFNAEDKCEALCSGYSCDTTCSWNKVLKFHGSRGCAETKEDYERRYGKTPKQMLREYLASLGLSAKEYLDLASQIK